VIEELLKNLPTATDAKWDGRDLILNENKIAKCTSVLKQYRIYTDKHLNEKIARTTYIVNTETGEIKKNNTSYKHRELVRMMRKALSQQGKA